ncbi:MAG: UPF0182 family protein [Clostridia bacterium]|jgi:hypothetical protein
MIYDLFKEKKKGSVKKIVIIAVIAAVLIIGAIIACTIYLNIIQLDEISNKLGNFSSVYIKNLIYKVISFLTAFISIFVVISVTNIFIKRNMNNYIESNGLEKRYLPNLPIAAIMSLFGAFIAQNMIYSKILSFLNFVPFGKTDPIFGKDIGYYVFQRPFLLTIYQFLLTLWIIVIIYTVIYYLTMLVSFYKTLTLENLKVKTILIHNLVNISILFIIKAFSYKFQSEGIVYSNFIDLKGAGYVDVNIWLKYFTFAPYLLMAIVIIAFAFILRNKLKGAAISIAVFPVVWIIVLIIAGVFQSFVVKPNALHYEKNYIKYNMEMTRSAFNFNKISSYDFPKMQSLTPEIINNNLDTVNNIRVVDYKATLDSDIQLQSITNFYTFKDGDIINYLINGKQTPIFITAREIDKSKLADQQKTYINNMFKYTHGYGVVVNPINKITAQGQVDFLLKDLRMESVDETNLKVTEPRIYYGEITDDVVITNPPGAVDKEKEIDYGNITTSYNGNGGIKLTLLNRLLFALKFSDLNMLISGNVDNNSKILLNREIISRVEMAVPFLKIDSEPYIVLSKDGRLKWILDAYTSTNDFPYSQEYDSVNYIRNSVKISVDAYNGNVECYIIDKTDPIIESYKKMYPEVFKTEVLPTYISEHMRYPESLLMTQTEVLKRYHLDPADSTKDNISMFYTNQDTWNIAKYPDSTNSEGVTDIAPYYNMIKLPGKIGQTEELILMRPFTPSGNKHNMVSWLAVRNSSAVYGDMILFNFPKNTNILGTDQVEININQITEISETMTLLGQRESKVFKGSLLVIPIENSVLYVEPLYIQADSPSAIPQVRKVVVGYQKGNDFKHGIGNTLNEALVNLFKDTEGPAVNPGGSDTPGTTGDTIDKATQAKVKEFLDTIKKGIDSSTSAYDDLLSLLQDKKIIK